MAYIAIALITGIVVFKKGDEWNVIGKTLAVCIISLTLSYIVCTNVAQYGFQESGKLISTMVVDTLNGSDYFREPTDDMNNLNTLTYTSNGREYHLTDADGQLCFYPIPNEEPRIEKYIVVYKSKVMNILFPRVKHEVYFKIYSMDI